MCGSRRWTSGGTAVRTQRDRSVRASDKDRDAVADRLRREAGVGRLEPDELEQRLEAALVARTLADLDGLTADLPRDAPRSERPRPQWRAWPGPQFVVPVVITLAIFVHPLVWFALIPLLSFGHGHGHGHWHGRDYVRAPVSRWR